MTGPAVATSTVLRRSDGLLAEELDGELVVLDQRTGALHVLNAPAALVWRCCDGADELGELAAGLAEATGADRAVVERDVLDASRALLAAGLLELSGDR